MELHLPTILITVVLTVIATLLFINLSGGEKRIDHELPRLYETDDAEFRRTLSALLGPPFAEGNKIETLLNGDAIFPAMLAAIRSARHTITFETFIYWAGTIGDEFVDALDERARAGVAVHVLLDWIGSAKMDAKLIERMEASGVEVIRFHKPSWSDLDKLNNRTHRKLLIIDGSVGFTGGVGIADQWRGNARNADEWRDTHFRVTGPVVSQMQAVFLDNWMRASRKVLHGELYFPKLKPAGEQTAQMFSSSPSGGSESMYVMYLMAITAARTSIYLANSYFVPDDMAINALIAAAKRGVKVRILTPGRHTDSALARRASRGQWGRMLEAGIAFAEFQPTMLHVKCLVVDELITSVGSTNFDVRSFRLNDEANLNVLCRDFARHQREVFEADWRRAKRITLEDWQGRPWREHVIERLALLLRSQI
ncbi:MAG TPA: phospholipase D-like domain-containing protein [Rubrivivax sp.]|nr:phospholipase D-like domain-containing protein [Rubrivivax sp.]